MVQSDAGPALARHNTEHLLRDPASPQLLPSSAAHLRWRDGSWPEHAVSVNAEHSQLTWSYCRRAREGRTICILSIANAGGSMFLFLLDLFLDGFSLLFPDFWDSRINLSKTGLLVSLLLSCSLASSDLPLRCSHETHGKCEIHAGEFVNQQPTALKASAWTWHLLSLFRYVPLHYYYGLGWIRSGRRLV